MIFTRSHAPGSDQVATIARDALPASKQVATIVGDELPASKQINHPGESNGNEEFNDRSSETANGLSYIFF